MEVLEVPSPRCELRLYAKDHHGSAVCTACGPRLPSTWNGAAVLDIGTIQIASNHNTCDHDELVRRAVNRESLARGWRARTKQTPRP